MKQSNVVADLIGKNLSEFTLEQLTEVYEVDGDGRFVKTIGCFRNEDIAKAFVQHQADSDYHRTRQVLVIVNGQIGFIFGESVTLLNDERTALEIRTTAIAKLSPEVRKILGLE